MSEQPSAEPGRVMALDLGEKRIGVALSDEMRIAVKPLLVLKRKSRKEDFERIGRLLTEHQVTLLVMGLPVTLSGREGTKAAWVRDYTAALGEHVSVPIEFWDESFSTIRAEAGLRARGVGTRRRRQQIDAAAAAVILQEYLDAQR
ncbi:MAG: Holliday junction resolvase RuvX [Anaerolineae bacterium]